MSLVPGAYHGVAANIKREKKRSSNMFSRSRRLSPHPGVLKSQESSLMSLYTVDTDVTTSSVQSLRKRFDDFRTKQDDKSRTLAMTELMAATQHIRDLEPRPKFKAPDYPPGIISTGRYVGVANEMFPDLNWATKRQFSRHNKESLSEWDIMKDCDKGKGCLLDGVHRHVMTSFDYNSVKHRPRVINIQRNGIPEASRGDKSYQSPEYSSGFHQAGSTRPMANFGGRKYSRTDTYIPLVEPVGRRKTFAEKEMDRQVEESADAVKKLEDWRPATPLVWRPSKNFTRTEFVAVHHVPPQ